MWGSDEAAEHQAVGHQSFLQDKKGRKGLMHDPCFHYGALDLDKFQV